jgi:glycine betaine/proline transport system substrate-binding protein
VDPTSGKGVVAVRVLRSRRLLGIALFVLVGAACQRAEEPAAEEPAGLPGEGVTIVAARPNWDTSYFDTEVVVKLLEELGYEVTPPEDKELAPEVFYPALARGEVDFWAEGWFPLHDPFFEEEVPGVGTVADAVTIVGVMVEAGALQGYLVDAASSEENGVTSLEQIAEDPDLRALYDRDGDGAADLIGCNEGWGCAVAINELLEREGWQEAIEHVQGEYSTLMVDTIARIERGEPSLYYTWTPNWTVGALVPGEDVVWIEAPSPPGEDTEVAGVAGCVEDPCEMGFAPNNLQIVANDEFLAENPVVARLFELIQIPVEDINAQNLLMTEGENTQEDIERHAEEWIAGHRDLVDGWLEEARAAAG